MLFCVTQLLYAVSYDYETLKNALLLNSPKLAQNTIGVQIAKKNIDVAYSGYYPSIRLSTTLEYSKKYNTYYTPSYIGDDSLTQSSGRYLSSSIYAGYEIFKFGATKYSIDAAKHNYIATNALACIKEKESVLSLLDAYSKVRIYDMQINEYKTIQKFYQELYTFSKRLHESGRIAKTYSMEYAQELAETLMLISQLKEQKAIYISQINYLSGINASEDDIFLPLDNSIKISKEVPFEESVTAKQLLFTIKQKELELKVKKTSFLPSVSLYGKYDFYGSSSDSYNDAFDDYKRNGYRVGISFSWPIFDGFRSKNDLDIAKLELLQARFALNDAKLAYQKEQIDIKSQIALQQERVYNAKDSADLANTLMDSNTALYDAGESDKITLYLNKIDRQKILISQHEANELLSANYKKREVMNEKERECVAH